MRKLHPALLWLFFSLVFLTTASAQYQFNSKSPATPLTTSTVSQAPPPSTNQFQLVPPDGDHVASSVFSTQTVNLNQNFVVTAQILFGPNESGGDGLAFILQREGPGYIGNWGAGLGYHRFPWETPIPSFIVEFDNFENHSILGGDDIGDPAEDHLGFMSNSDAYHTTADALAAPIPFATNIEDGAWHDVIFSWNVATQNFTVQYLGNTYTYHGDLAAITGGNTEVYWGFTASTGNAHNEHSVRILSMVSDQPLSVTGTVTNTCAGGNIVVTPAGGVGGYTYSWSNGATAKDLTNVAPGNYTVTVSDASGATKQAMFTVTGDNIAPQISCTGNFSDCYNLLSLYSIPQLTATDNCFIASINYTITGATTRNGTGKNASGFFNPGVSNIVWTVKDARGNTSTCTTQVTINKINITIPDVVTVNPGGSVNTIYLGYGPTSVTLTANATGGTGAYTYQWSNGATTPSITVNPSSPGLHAYIVTVKDASGCWNVMIKVIRVVDVRCGNNKVMVCHIPPGNSKKSNEICISKNDVASHLAHGDKLGSCDGWDDDKTVSRPVSEEVTTTNPSTGAYPNPTKGKLELRLNNTSTGTAQVLIINANGVTVEKKTIQLTSKTQLINLDLSNKFNGVYVIKVLTNESEQTEKIIVQR